MRDQQLAGVAVLVVGGVATGLVLRERIGQVISQAIQLDAGGPAPPPVTIPAVVPLAMAVVTAAIGWGLVLAPK